MIKTIEAKGDTIDAAIQNALAKLGCQRDDVSVEVIAKPKSGFLGLGKEPALVKVTYETSPAGKAKDFLEGLLIRFGVQAHIVVKEDSENKIINMELSGEGIGAVIGRRGDTLDAFQYLTSIITNKDEDDRWRVVVDAENYRQKREGALVSLAHKTAQKALKYNKSVALEPMNPQERRIIHSTLQDTAGVTTCSVGNEPNRKVIVSPAGMSPAKQGERKEGGNGRPGAGGKPGGNNRRPPRRNGRGGKPNNKPQEAKAE